MAVNSRKKADNLRKARARARSRRPSNSRSNGDRVPSARVFRTYGGPKLSVCLLDMLAPFRDTWESVAEFRTMVEMAVVAWNATLLPPSNARATLSELPEPFDELVDRLMIAKTRLFALDVRRITSFEVGGTLDNLALDVEFLFESDEEQ